MYNADIQTPNGFGTLKSAFDDAVSKALVDRSGAWDVATEGWQTSQSMGLSEIADKVGALKVGLHETLTRPAADVLSERFELNPMQSLSTAAVLEAYPIPGDTLVRDLKLLMQVTGMLVGVATGHPLVANACFKSWIHGEVRRFVSRSVNDFFSAAKPKANQNVKQEARRELHHEARGELAPGLLAAYGVAQVVLGRHEISKAYSPHANAGSICFADPRKHSETGNNTRHDHAICDID